MDFWLKLNLAGTIILILWALLVIFNVSRGVKHIEYATKMEVMVVGWTMLLIMPSWVLWTLTDIGIHAVELFTGG